MHGELLVYYGGGEMIYNIILGITALLGDDSFRSSMIYIVSVIAGSWIGLRALSQGSPKIILPWLVGFITMTTLFMQVTVNIRIQDKVTGFERPITHVPWLFGKLASALNMMSVAMTEKFETAFAVLPASIDGMPSGSYLPYYENGTVFASRLMAKARDFRAVDPEFEENLERFVNQCVVHKALMGSQFNYKELSESDDIWELVKSRASPVMGFSYRDTSGGGSAAAAGRITPLSSIVSCRRGAELLEAKWAGQIDALSKKYGNRFFVNKPESTAKTLFLSKLGASYELLTHQSLEASKLLRQKVMMNALRSGPNKKLSELGSVMNYATTKTMIQQKTNFQVAGEVAGETLPIMKVVLEALTYASFIFIFFLVLLPDGIKYLKIYFELLLTLQLWPVLYAVLNLIMTLYARNETTGILAGGGGTYSQITAAGIEDINSNIAAYAGYWSMLIPIFSYMITKGGVSSLIHAAGHIGNAFMSASSSASQEAISGNMSLGNVNYNNRSFNNVSGNKFDDSIGFRSGQVETLMGDGSVQTIQPDGNVVFKAGVGHTVSDMGTRLSSNDNYTKQIGESLNRSTSRVESLQNEYSEGRTQLGQQGVDLAESLSRSQALGNGYDTSTNLSEGSAMSNALDFKKAISDKWGFSEQDAGKITGMVSAGIKTPDALSSFFSAKGELIGTFDTTASRDKAIQELTDLGESMGVTNSLSKMEQQAKSLRFSDTNSEDARLAESFSQSYQTNEGMRESISKQMTYQDNLSQMEQDMKSGNFSLDRNLSQGLLDHVAHSKINGHEVGYYQGRRMIDANAKEARPFIREYKESLWKDFEAQLQQKDHVMTDLERQKFYEEAASARSYMESKPQEVSRGTFETAKQDVLNAGNQKGLRQGFTDNGMREDFESQLASAQHQLDSQESEIRRTRSQMKGKVQDLGEKSVATTAAKNAGGNTAKAAKNMFKAVTNTK